MKHASGSMNPTDILASPISPISTGAMAPPTIDIMRNDDAVLVCSPCNPERDMENMVGNMMLSNRYVRHKAAIPYVPLDNIVTAMHATAPMEHAVIIVAGRILRINADPSNLPVMKSPIPPNDSISAAVCADMGADSVT